MTPDKRELLRQALAENVIPITDRERREIEAEIAAEFISDLDVLKLVLVDWDFKTKQGEFIPFTPANLEQYSEEIDGFDAAFVSGYFDAMRKASQPGEVEKTPASSPALPRPGCASERRRTDARGAAGAR